METVIRILEGILIGIVGGVLILYGLRPSEAYPTWMLIPYDRPWMFLIAIIVIGYIGAYHRLLGALLFLLVVSLYMDLILFGRPAVFKNDRWTHAPVPTSVPEATVASSAKWANIGIPLSDVNLVQPNYPLLQGLHDAQPGEPAEFLPSL